MFSMVHAMKSRAIKEGILAVLLAVSAPWVCAQAVSAQDLPVYSRTPALETSRSQAERQAEDTVSLSAEKLISLLRRETGLLLEVKKLLVRKAFEQGRILDPNDLTDESLFRLLREENTIRVLVTQEVARRQYIKALPTPDERRRELAAQGVLPPTTDLPEKTGSQEDRYWAEEAKREAEELKQAQPPNNPQNNPQLPPGLPAIQPQFDSRRAVEMAQLQSQSQDLGDFDGPEETGSMSRISPDQLALLMRASSGTQTASALGGSAGGALSGGSMGGSMSLPMGLDAGALQGLQSSALSGAADPFGAGSGFPQGQTSLGQRASLDTGRDRMLLPRIPRPDHAPLRHQVNPYADVPSLYDMYSQYGRVSPKLVRFGDDIFKNGTGNFEQLPMDLPVGPDYILGPGDGININLSGGISQRLRRVVDREGRIALPEAGAVQVSGRSLGDVQRMVQTTLQREFRNVQAEVSLARLRTIRVYVVGDVERAGAYDISALSSPLNAVFMAGGPTSRGSLRILRHYRGNELVEDVDVYDLLLHGVRAGVQHLQSGDTVLVPPLGSEVTVEGMVRRPAIYELHGEKNLAEVLELSGGVLTTGTLRHVDVERVQAHETRTMLRLDIPENNNQASVDKALDDFSVQDGDKIKISPILPYADQTVYLEGHVFRPGKYAFQDGMLITDLIKSYKDLLPEPSKLHAEIVRLNPPDYTPQVIAFNLDDALSSKAQSLALKPFDTVRIFSRFDFEDPPIVTVAGEVRDPGDHLTNGATRVRDAVYLAGGLTPNASTDSVQILRRTGDNKLTVLSVDLKLALAGDDKDNIPLEPKDRLVIHRNLAKTDPPTVTIEGDVGRPGKYPLGQDMTAAELVRTAGGFKRSAFTESADLTRYTVEGDKKVVGEHDTIQIARAVAGDPDTDMRLRDGDVLTIRQLAGWRDVGATITLTGEVMHPGTYGIENGERLSSVIARAGGLRSDAYPYGAVFERVQVRELAERNRTDLLRTVEEEGPALKAAPDGDADQKAAKDAALMQWQTTMERLEMTPPAGRMVIHITKDTKRWRNTVADIQVRAGDDLYIPKVPNSVMVDGAVYNPTAVSYKPGRSAAWYLSQAGGPSNVANKKNIFVIRADGSVIAGKGGMFGGGVESAQMRPGDLVMVPEKTFSANTRWKSILEGSQVAYAVGIAIQVARSF